MNRSSNPVSLLLSFSELSQTVYFSRTLVPPEPAQEMIRVKVEVKEIQTLFTTFSPLDRVGSTISLLIHTQLYLWYLNWATFSLTSFRKCPKASQEPKAIGEEGSRDFELVWLGETSFNDAKYDYHEFLLDCQSENYGRQFLQRALPVVMLILLACFSFKLLVLFTLASIISWSAYNLIYYLLPEGLAKKIDNTFIGKISRNSSCNQWATILKNIRPFFAIGLYAIPPVALVMMIGHWLATTLGFEKILEMRQLQSRRGLVLRQNIEPEKAQEQGFIHSRAFAMTIIAMLLTGLPSLLAFYLYTLSGLDAVFGYPSRDPQFLKIMFINLYIGAIGTALSVLFFRAWFTFPLNFLSAEYNIDLNETKIEKQNAKGWFSVCMLWGWQSDLFSAELAWKNVKSVEFSQGLSFRLYPLPPVFFAENSQIFKTLNRLAALFDSVSSNKAIGNRLEIIGKRGELIEIRVDELNSKAKKELFSYIRKYAPHAAISEQAQKALVGSTVLRDPQHTELWFDLLLDKAKVAYDEVEKSNLSLRNGKFTILRKITSGGQASVYLASDSSGNSVILKEFVLPEGKVEFQLESMIEFENESLILSRLDHPQIVRLVDQFIENCRAYLVIEYVQGKTLRELVSELVSKNAAMSEEQVLTFAKQMVEILAYLESLSPQVVHRDFTSDNLIVQEDGTLKLIDFGISHIYKTGVSGDCAGKHSYTPPEQYRGEATPQSDIYAFGATLAFLLTGEDPQPIAASRPRESRADIGQALSDLVAKATAPSTADRYENTQWLKLDLDSIVLSTI
ncbi:hypothetical protein BH11CYA1_BH11CYA1_10460 [soil metagenome]